MFNSQDLERATLDWYLYEGELEMGSEEGNSRSGWSVFDGVKSFRTTPEGLMEDIDAAIKKLECTRATKLLDSPPSLSQLKNKFTDVRSPTHYDARVADEAYRAGCAALAAGKLDEALQFFNISLAKCPPDKTSAVAKLQSLISLTSQELHKLST